MCVINQRAPTKNGHPTQSACPFFLPPRLPSRRYCALSVNGIFQRFTRFERNGVARLDFHRLAGLRVFAGAGAAVALQEGAEANQGDAVLAVQGAGDFFENGVEDAVDLFFGEIRFFRGQRGRRTKRTDLFKHRLAKQMRNLNKSVPLSGSNVTPKKAVTLIEKWLKGEGLMK
ncbi:hypothetical protein PS687_04008 [Pseudomonas fluorescens]|nr:hypothetical protein PS687_04008 [Pseudomonas fluorescens]